MNKKLNIFIITLLIISLGMASFRVSAAGTSTTSTSTSNAATSSLTSSSKAESNVTSSSATSNSGSNANTSSDNASSTSSGSTSTSTSSSSSTKPGTQSEDIDPTAAVNWPKSFAIWTEGLRSPGILRNKYGYIVSSTHAIEEYVDSGQVYLSFYIIAYNEWLKSKHVEFYILSKDGNNQFSGQTLATSDVHPTIIENYSRTALWRLDVNVSGISGNEIQFCIFDDDTDYGFWKTNGVANDDTYPFIISSPIIGWNNIPHEGIYSDYYYAGQNNTLTFEAPKLQKNVASFDNEALTSAITTSFSSQEVVGDQLETKYTMFSDLTKLTNTTAGLVPENGDKGLMTTLTFNFPSKSIKYDLQYGGSQNIELSPETFAKNTIDTADYIDSGFIDKVKSAKNVDGYSWYYSTSANPNNLTKISSTYPTTKNANGSLSSSMKLDADTDFGKFLSKELSAGETVYLLMELTSNGQVVTISNPIVIQAEAAQLEVPNLIDFGEIESNSVVNGASFDATNTSEDEMKVTIPKSSLATWEVTAQVPEDGTLAKFNAKLNLLGIDILTKPTSLVSVDKTGESTYPLAPKLIFSGYHGIDLAAQTYNEEIDWKLAPQASLPASD